MRNGKKNSGSISTSLRSAAAFMVLLTLVIGAVTVISKSRAEAVSSSEREAPTAGGPQQGRDFISPQSVEDIQEQKRILASARQALELKLKNLRDASGEREDDPMDDQKIDHVAVTRLISIYENMSPREAAAVFNVMDPHVLVAISARMNTRKLSAIMAQMSRERVNMVSQYLVGVRKFHKNFSLSLSDFDEGSENETFSRENNARYGLSGRSKSNTESLLPSRQ